MKNFPWFSKMSTWLVSIMTPLVILMISVRILISPLFAQIEYQLPGFPEDPFGFTLEDRLRWSEPSIKYLVNTEGIGYLESLRFENGEPIYNGNELSHMEDVKAVVTGMRIALAALTVTLLILTAININKGKKLLILNAYNLGGWGVLGLIAGILVLLVISFDQLFTWFHQIFFESGTWRFYTSDTLIRLFPMRFWRDAFVFVGALSILLGIITVLVTEKFKKLEKSK